MNQPKPNGFQRGPSDDGDKLMVASGRHADDPPAVPRPQELKEWMQVTQIRGSLRERVFNYVTSTDVYRVGRGSETSIRVGAFFEGSFGLEEGVTGEEGASGWGVKMSDI
eukprot:1358872-Amorphochlora_amoeboformis.AAC.1